MKIVGINVILPNYEAKYKVNEKINILMLVNNEVAFF